MKYDLDKIKEYAFNHKIKEVKNFFNFPSYEATKGYLQRHKISHITESRVGENNPSYKHGGKGTRLYDIWCGMKSRCYNKNDYHYHRWGGRGIIICSEWLLDFSNFRDWAYKNGYAENLTIDRIDNNGSYEPSNCRWITLAEQNNNQRTNRMITYKGKTQNIKQWAKELNINYGTLKSRLDDSHWSVEKAFELKTNNRNCR